MHSIGGNIDVHENMSLLKKNFTYWQPWRNDVDNNNYVENKIDNYYHSYYINYLQYIRYHGMYISIKKQKFKITIFK